MIFPPDFTQCQSNSYSWNSVVKSHNPQMLQSPMSQLVRGAQYLQPEGLLKLASSLGFASGSAGWVVWLAAPSDWHVLHRCVLVTSYICFQINHHIAYSTHWKASRTIAFRDCSLSSHFVFKKERPSSDYCALLLWKRLCVRATLITRTIKNKVINAFSVLNLDITGARCSVVVWDKMLQAGRSRDWFWMRPLNVFQLT
jgi:hypothetical protein